MAVNGLVAYGGFIGLMFVGFVYQFIQANRPIKKDIPIIHRIPTTTDKQPMEETQSPFWYGIFEEYD